jgi:hypothetical protein
MGETASVNKRRLQSTHFHGAHYQDTLLFAINYSVILVLTLTNFVKLTKYFNIHNDRRAFQGKATGQTAGRADQPVGAA